MARLIGKPRYSPENKIMFLDFGAACYGFRSYELITGFLPGATATARQLEEVAAAKLLSLE